MGGVGAGVGEPLPAVVAAEGFVSGMDPDMLLQKLYNECSVPDPGFVLLYVDLIQYF